MTGYQTSNLKAVVIAAVLAASSFTLASGWLTPAEAGTTHYYESNDWPSNPNLWMASNMYYPLNTYAENATYSVDDPWDAVSGSWLNILVQGKKSITHGLTLGDVPSDTIYISDMWINCTSTYGCTLGTTYTGVSFPNVWDVDKALIVINEDNDIDWNAYNDSSMGAGEADILSTLIHEVGHAVRMGHNNGTGGTCPGATSNSSLFAQSLTMCGTKPIWTGSGTVFPAQRTLRSHEKTDYAAQY